MRAGTRKRHDKWMTRMLRILEREGPMSTKQLRNHPKMKNCDMGHEWVRDRLNDLATMSIIEYDYTQRKWILQ